MANLNEFKKMSCLPAELRTWAEVAKYVRTLVVYKEMQHGAVMDSAIQKAQAILAALESKKK